MENKTNSPSSTHMTFLQHLEELRMVVIRCVIAIMIGTCISYLFCKTIVSFMIKELPPMVFISPFEVVVVYLKVALFCGVVCTLPYVLFQIISFIVEVFSTKQRKYVYFFTPCAIILFAGGFCFSSFILVPISMRFFLTFVTDHIQPMISLNKYVSFVGVLSLFSGSIFQMPLLSALLTKLHVLSPHILITQWRQMLVGILVLAAVVTPSTDIFNQMLLAGPMLLLYIISIGISFCVMRK